MSDYLIYKETTNTMKPEEVSFLAISEKRFSYIDKQVFDKLTKIKSLFFVNCSLLEFPENIKNLTDLESIYMSNNKLFHTIPFTIGDCINLEHLQIERSPIKTLPNTIKNLSKLQFLKLKGIMMHALPESISEMHSLTTLIVSFNQLRSITNLNELKSLTHLDVCYNKLDDSKDFFSNIAALNQLESLDISNNKLVIDDEAWGYISQMKDLDYLGLANCGIKKIPAYVLLNLTKLKFIHLSENDIQLTEKQKIMSLLPDECEVTFDPE